MSTQITINDITGASPFDIYVCDDPITTCIYVATINSVPYSFNVPLIMDGQLTYNLKIVDNNECTIIQNLII